MEHAARRALDIRPILQGLSRADARSVEQVLIETYKLQRQGGTLLNVINSIAKTKSIYAQSIARGLQILADSGIF
jgi:hypothetical protein